jgi:hypothetical protein
MDVSRDDFQSKVIPFCLDAINDHAKTKEAHAESLAVAKNSLTNVFDLLAGTEDSVPEQDLALALVAMAGKRGDVLTLENRAMTVVGMLSEEYSEFPPAISDSMRLGLGQLRSFLVLLYGIEVLPRPEGKSDVEAAGEAAFRLFKLAGVESDEPRGVEEEGSTVTPGQTGAQQSRIQAGEQTVDASFALSVVSIICEHVGEGAEGAEGAEGSGGGRGGGGGGGGGRSSSSPCLFTWMDAMEQAGGNPFAESASRWAQAIEEFGFGHAPSGAAALAGELSYHRAVRGKRIGQVRLTRGYAGWLTSQLNIELERNVWMHVEPVTPEEGRTLALMVRCIR